MSKSHCNCGHAMTPKNTRVVHPKRSKFPWRQCRACMELILAASLRGNGRNHGKGGPSLASKGSAPRSVRTGCEGMPGCRHARLAGVQRPHACLPRSCPTVPSLGDALNAGYRHLEVKCLGCEMYRTVALDIVRRPKWTPIHELERYMRCKECSPRADHAFRRSHLVALRTNKISAMHPPSTWWPGER